MKENLIKLINKIDREDVLNYIRIITEDIVEEVYGDEVLSNGQ